MDGVRVHARIMRPARAAGPPIVLLHGLGVSSASLDPLARRLAERHLVLSCDLPGFGLSDDDRVWPTAEIAAVVARLLKLRGAGRVVLAGHSYGCVVAAMLAADHPGLARALVLLSPAFDRRFGSMPALIARLALDASMERPTLVAGGLRDYLRAGVPRVLATMREAAGIPLQEVIARVAVPLLVVRGSRDPLTTARWAHELAARARPAGAVATIRGAAHGLGHDAPTVTAAAVERFLGTVVQASAGTGLAQIPRSV